MATTSVVNSVQFRRTTATARTRHGGDVTLPVPRWSQRDPSMWSLLKRRLHTIHNYLNTNNTPHCTYLRLGFECIVDEAYLHSNLHTIFYSTYLFTFSVQILKGTFNLKHTNYDYT